MSCSSARELLLLVVCVTLHTSYHLLMYNLVWNVGNQSESKVKCSENKISLKIAGQLEKYLSPTSPNGHVKR